MAKCCEPERIRICLKQHAGLIEKLPVPYAFSNILAGTEPSLPSNNSEEKKSALICLTNHSNPLYENPGWNPSLMVKHLVAGIRTNVARSAVQLLNPQTLMKYRYSCFSN